MGPATSVYRMGDWLTREEVAERLRLTPTEVDELLDDPGSALQCTTRRLVSEEDLAAWVESRTFLATGPDDPRIVHLREQIEDD